MIMKLNQELYEWLVEMYLRDGDVRHARINVAIKYQQLIIKKRRMSEAYR